MEPTAVAPEALKYEAARARVLEAARTLPPEVIATAKARGRALRADLDAPHALPPFRNSAMDGFAVRSADLAGASGEGPVTLPVSGILPAGEPAPPLAPGETLRVMTGAPLPEGADAVVPVENAEWLGSASSPGRARFVAPVAAGASVREAGADLAAGARALAAGRELSAHDLAVLVSLGYATVPVGPAPRVAILSTGDELLGAEDALRPGAIRDSNTPMLGALLEECGAVVERAERLPDDPSRVAAAIASALERADAVLAIGGVSAGDFDPVKVAIATIGGIALWRVAMRPGRPQAFGGLSGRLFFGLPGNPGSVACVFEALVRPALRKLQGFATLDRPRLEVRAAPRIGSAKGRTDFVRATIAWRDGAWWATPAGEQVSGHLMPQSRAHVLLVVPEGTAALEPGDPASALLLRWPDPEA